MILVESDSKWPTRPVWLDLEELTLADVVAKGIAKWQHQTGTKPTDVIFGPKAIAKLREETMGLLMSRHVEINPNKPPVNEYMGLTFHRDYNAQGVTLLTQGPAHML